MNTKIERIDSAIFEAHRFIKRAKEWKKRVKDDKYVSMSGSREGGAAKRASMDLSRALAEIRR